MTARNLPPASLVSDATLAGAGAFCRPATSAPVTSISAERLRELLEYSPDTGEFRWKVKSKTRWVRPGAIAGCVDHHGYRRIVVAGHRYAAHRLAWFYVHGRWPSEQIDHINGDGTDNRICNLREASHAENQQYKGATKRSSTGLKGAYRRSKGRCGFSAAISVNGKVIRLGDFLTAEEAHAAYTEAARKYHGEFARLA
jgi:hypothetical protein